MWRLSARDLWWSSCRSLFGLIAAEHGCAGLLERGANARGASRGAAVAGRACRRRYCCSKGRRVRRACASARRSWYADAEGGGVRRRRRGDPRCRPRMPRSWRAAPSRIKLSVRSWRSTVAWRRPAPSRSSSPTGFRSCGTATTSGHGRSLRRAPQPGSTCVSVWRTCSYLLPDGHVAAGNAELVIAAVELIGRSA